MTCQEVTELVTNYLEGKLSFWTRVRFQVHLGMCVHCRRYLRQTRATIAALGGLAPPPPPPEVQEELLRRLRNWKG